jgi:hypothetical protein
MARIRTILIIAACCSATLWIGCGDDDDTTNPDSGNGGAGSGGADSGKGGSGGKDSGTADSGARDSGAADSGEADSGTSVANLQTPPMGQAAIEAWLKDGVYKEWSCEAQVHASRPPSPHGFNRICSNAVISDDAGGSGAWAAGAAAVKEMYTSASAKTPSGYAVYLKTAKSSAGGDNWYWYARVPDNSIEAHDANNIAADGMGDGQQETVCVACHTAAGSDAAHTPSSGSRDFVYTPVP